MDFQIARAIETLRCVLGVEDSDLREQFNELLITAGLLWRCENEECRDMLTLSTQLVCQVCGKRQPLKPGELSDDTR